MPAICKKCVVITGHRSVSLVLCEDHFRHQLDVTWPGQPLDNLERGG